MVTEAGFTAGKARERSFFTIVNREGTIKRGKLVTMMGCSHDVFSREYMDYLDANSHITYDPKLREFAWSK